MYTNCRRPGLRPGSRWGAFDVLERRVLCIVGHGRRTGVQYISVQRAHCTARWIRGTALYKSQCKYLPVHSNGEIGIAFWALVPSHNARCSASFFCSVCSVLFLFIMFYIIVCYLSRWIKLLIVTPYTILQQIQSDAVKAYQRGKSKTEHQSRSTDKHLSDDDPRAPLFVQNHLYLFNYKQMWRLCSQYRRRKTWMQ